MNKFTQAYAKIINVLNSKARRTVSESVEAPTIESANEKNRKRRLIKESAENGFEDGLDAKLEAGGFYLDTANYVCYLPNESYYYIIVEKKVFQRWLSCNSSAWLRWSRPNLVSCR